MNFTYNTDAIHFVEDVIKFLTATINDWKDTLPGVIYYQRAAFHVQQIIGPVVSKDEALQRFLRLYIKDDCNDKSTGANEKQRILKDIIRPLYSGTKRLDKLISERKSSPSKIKKLLKLYVEVEECEQQLASETNKILSGLNQLFQLAPVAAMSQQPSIKSFETDLTKEAYDFWQRSIGPNLIGTWDKFSQSYTQLYSSVQPIVLEYIRMLLCAKDGHTINMYGFLELTSKHGFPVEQLPKHMWGTDQPISEESRAEIAKMVIPLVTEFSSPEIQQHLLALYDWYKGVPRNDQDAFQQRANEWARLIKEARSATEKSELHLKAEQVDNARRALSFFYQRFMVMWRIGSVSREIFAGVSFPGKPRIKDFIRLVRPLDFANYSIVIGAEKPWNPPKVYHFLSELV